MPEYVFRIVKGAKAQIYVQVPAWLRISQAGVKDGVIAEIPTQILSKTWFGMNSIEGEHCYWISTVAQRTTEGQSYGRHVIHCPVRIINRSEDDLNVEKLALRVQRLSVFEKDGELWSDETTLTYRGSSQYSKIELSGKPPRIAAGAALITAPREATPKGFAAKTFASLKELSRF